MIFNEFKERLDFIETGSLRNLAGVLIPFDVSGFR